MRIQLSKLTLQCQESRETVDFSPQITYFHGRISAGKSSIVRLVDYCLGGKLERTPAINRCLVSVQLSAQIGNNSVLFERRVKEANDIQVTWEDPDTAMASVLAPTQAGPEPIWGNDIFNVSDLVFFLAGLTPIKVRKSKQDEYSQLVRLSLRDIMWYCYLEQDKLDSSFYELKDPFRGLKSRDAMRFFTGSYTERMNELEIQLDDVRSSRSAKSEAAKQVRQFLEEFGYSLESEVAADIESAERQLQDARAELAASHQQHIAGTHFADDLRAELQTLAHELGAQEQALADLSERIAEQEALRAELLSAKFKLARAESAAAVLSGVTFDYCPACGAALAGSSPQGFGDCRLCGRDSSVTHMGGMPQAEVVRLDLGSRIDDLGESIAKHRKALKLQERLTEELRERKRALDEQLTKALVDYDSAFLARSRELERRAATLEERRRGLEKTARMPQAIARLEREASELRAREEEIAREIGAERNKLSEAEGRIRDLQEAYLESLERVGVPGIGRRDRVEINSRTWIPWIVPDQGDAYSFYNAGSGGKKTLLNVCYALAVHKVAAQHGLPVPTLLMIDTPMKNIGEDVNEDIFEAFYSYLYELAHGPLSATQFVIVDKEYFAPRDSGIVEILERYMSPDNPLISYYRGP